MTYNKTLMMALLSGVVTSTSSLAATNITYSQDFGVDELPVPKVQEDFNKGSWSLVQFNQASTEPSQTPSILRLVLPEVERANYANGSVVNDAINGEIHFEAIWTRATLKAMLGLDNFNTLREIYTVKEIRTAVNAVCAPVIELGTAATYGAPYPITTNAVNYVAELDTDSKHCRGQDVTLGDTTLPILSGNAANVRLRTFVPTIPGATYTLDVEFQKRSTSSRDVGDLIVRVGGDVTGVDGVAGIDWDEGDQRAVFPTEPSSVDTNTLEHGFFKGTVTFEATRFFTPINLRDNGVPDSYGVLLDDITVTQTIANGNHKWCSMLFKPQSKNMKLCLQGDGEEDESFFSCDFNNLASRNVKVTAGDPTKVQDLTGTKGSPTFFRVGLNGRVVVPMAGKGCPIYNNTLVLNEFTNSYPNQDFEGYPEQGTITAVLRCYDANDDSMYTRNVVLDKVQPINLNSNFTPADKTTLLRTNQDISHTFDADMDKSCRLVAVRMKDKTPKISPQVITSDGFEIQGLNIIVNDYDDDNQE